MGEIMPDGDTCSNSQILKKNTDNDWGCAADEGAGSAGSWQAVSTNVLAPTNTAAGILVNAASSTITTLRVNTLNATTTVVDSLQVGGDAAITDITGAGLVITSGALSVDTASGINLSHWQQSATVSAALTPTSTSAGIFVLASSTFNS